MENFCFPWIFKCCFRGFSVCQAKTLGKTHKNGKFKIKYWQKYMPLGVLHTKISISELALRSYWWFLAHTDIEIAAKNIYMTVSCRETYGKTDSDNHIQHTFHTKIQLVDGESHETYLYRLSHTSWKSKGPPFFSGPLLLIHNGPLYEER